MTEEETAEAEHIAALKSLLEYHQSRVDKLKAVLEALRRD